MKPCAFCKSCVLNQNNKYVCINSNTTYGVVKLSHTCEHFEKVK